MTATLEARAFVLDRLGERPRLERLTVAPPGPGEVRVRMLAAGLCHTDFPGVMEDALASLAPGGELVLVGATARDALMSFHPRAFLSKQQRITGCVYGSARPHEHLPKLLDWCADGTIPLADLIGRRVTFDELEDAFDEPANGGVRTVVTFP